MVRYRKLKRSFDLRGYWQIVRATWTLPGGSRYRTEVPKWSEVRTHNHDGALEALLSAPRNVHSSEHEGTLEEVRALIRFGKLSPTDLVDAGRGWQTVGECWELNEAVDEVTRRRRRIRNGVLVLLAAAAGSGAWLWSRV